MDATNFGPDAERSTYNLAVIQKTARVLAYSLFGLGFFVATQGVFSSPQHGPTTRDLLGRDVCWVLAGLILAISPPTQWGNFKVPVWFARLFYVAICGYFTIAAWESMHPSRLHFLVNP